MWWANYVPHYLENTPLTYIKVFFNLFYLLRADAFVLPFVFILATLVPNNVNLISLTFTQNSFWINTSIHRWSLLDSPIINNGFKHYLYSKHEKYPSFSFGNRECTFFLT